ILAGDGKHAYLLIGLAIILLALAAPYLDNWLSRVSSVKTSVVELQLTSSAGHAIAVAEAGEALTNLQSLERLANYDKRIRDDIDYINVIEIPDLEWQMSRYRGHAKELEKQIADLRDTAGEASKLVVVFEGLISPIAGC